MAGLFVRNVFEEVEEKEEEEEEEEEDSNALSWVLCAADNKDEEEVGTKEKRKNVHKTKSNGRSSILVFL